MELKVGSKIMMKSPGNYLPLILCHIEAIIENPDDKLKENRMVVYRYWLKSRKCWLWKMYAYWELAMYNDWDNENTK